LIGEGALAGLALALPPSVSTWIYYVLMLAVLLLTSAGLGIITSSVATLHQQRQLVEEGYYSRLEVAGLLREPYAQPVHRSTYPDLYRGVIIVGGLISVAVIIAVMGK
jgi:hypothetical protein